MQDIPKDQPPKESPDAKVGHEANPDEPPPTYSPPIPSGSSQTHTFKTKPTNFLALSSNQDAIRGEFVIDPSLRIPDAMLPPLGADETEGDRKNLSLRSHESVHVDIWLLPSPKQRTTVVLASSHNSVHAQLHAVDGASFALRATAPHGSVKLALPRGFTGLLVLGTKHGSVKLSEALMQHATQLGQVGDNRRYFVGDFGLFGDEWEGDQVEAESVHESVKVKYVDEEDGQGKKGLFSRLFKK